MFAAPGEKLKLFYLPEFLLSFLQCVLVLNVLFHNKYIGKGDELFSKTTSILFGIILQMSIDDNLNCNCMAFRLEGLS